VDEKGYMDDSEAYYQVLQCAIAELHGHLDALPAGDPGRDPHERNLLWCYREAFAVLSDRMDPFREQRTTGAVSGD
jgi:hypothetical protein